MPEETINLPPVSETPLRPETSPGRGESRAERPQSPKSARRDERPQTPTFAPAPDITGEHATGGASRPVSIKEIERVLSADLEDIYFQMPPAAQAEFKKQGEETARAVQNILEKTKVNAKKIANLIMRWLKIIPGVNRFFLTQESKIRTDEVLKLKAEMFKSKD